jgi:hypothetical protein
VDPEALASDFETLVEKHGYEIPRLIGTEVGVLLAVPHAQEALIVQVGRFSGDEQHCSALLIDRERALKARWATG